MITAEAVIDLMALKNNLSFLAKKQPGSGMIAVVKGDAYGHGAIKVARTLNKQADGFAVARLEEALILRKNGIEKPIILLEGCFSQEETIEAAQHHLEPVVQNDVQISWLKMLSQAQSIKLWMKIDTGMHRLGFYPHEVASRHEILSALPAVQFPVGFVSHLSLADEPQDPQTDKQLACFKEVTAPFNGPKSLANSAALLTRPDICFDKARPGIAMYGVSPMSGRCGQDEGIQPVMTLRSQLIAVRSHLQGEPVGYGANWHASEDTKIGVVAMGYGDGYPRSMPSGTPVWINGRIVPLVGRVSMDMLTVDLGADTKDSVGDQVILWGPQNPVEQIAERVGTIGYELLIQLAPRVKRTYINE
ncbi:MAG: Alanine racemase, biosynthetic [Candidatus Celerinatantimonas neptuna]|nr:MAG: Alanine racemase, biosynthetic [Candidatus Celerinatantimonas neptuna]